MLRVCFVHLAQQGVVAALPQQALLVHLTQQAQAPFEQLHALRIVRKVRCVPAHALARIFLNLGLKHGRVEERLQLLVRVVDEQLLEPILREVFEAVDV